MKHLGFLALLSAALFATAPVSAQNSGGLLMDRDIVTPSDLFELSQTTFSLGTARSMAMAGAFTSLGADLTSMAINPAGLGMYRRNEISITPLMSFARAENNAPAFNSNGKNRFSIGNFGFTANVYEGSGPLVSVNIGFGYNRLQDLNYQYSYYTQGNVSSIADVSPTCCNTAASTGIRSPAASTGATSIPASGVRSSDTRQDYGSNRRQVAADLDRQQRRYRQLYDGRSSGSVGEYGHFGRT